MTSTELINKITQVEELSKVSKWRRLFNNPFKYIFAIGLKNGLYPIFHKPYLKRSKLFTGQDLTLMLPAATDIFLTGGKSHITEIQLSKFLIKNLNLNALFLGYWCPLRLFFSFSFRIG